MMTTCRNFFLFALLLCTIATFAQKKDYTALGKRIAMTSADIQPGDVVVIYGGRHTIDLMEAIAIEAQKQGGLVQPFLNTDQIQYSLFHDVKDEYLAQEPTYFEKWFKEIDVWIGLPAIEDFESIYKDVPEEKFAIASKAYESFNDNLNNSNVRGVFLNYPTPQQASNVGLDFATYEKMHWDAIDTDYDKIAMQAKKLEEMLLNSEEVKVTTPAGTDLTFSVAGRASIIDDGIVTKEDADAPMIFQRTASLPGGNLNITIVEDSGNGTVAIRKARCNFAPVEYISFSFENGVMQNFKAREGQRCIEKVFAQQKGDYNKISSIQIGLNPALKVMEDGDADFRNGNAAGMVYLSIGDNGIIGGNNKADGNFSYSFPLTNATVSIDGEVIVKEGVLQL